MPHGDGIYRARRIFCSSSPTTAIGIRRGTYFLNNGFPGWLYEVDMGCDDRLGARWDGIRPDGTLNPDNMWLL